MGGVKGPFRRDAKPDDSRGDEHVQRRLRELAERDARAPRPVAQIAPVPVAPKVTRSPQAPLPQPAQPPAFAPPQAPVTYAPQAYGPQPPFATQLTAVAPKPRKRWALRIVAGLLALFVGMIVVGWIGSTGPQGWTSKADRSNPLPAWPEPPEGVQAAPIGQPPTNVPSADSYIFMRTQTDLDEPVTYDPCAPIHYVVNDRTAFDGALDELDAAVAEVEKATGLVFVNDGPTDEAPVEGRAYQDKHYGKSWSPVLISWSDRFEYDGLKGGVVGRGGSSGIRQGEYQWLVTGAAVFDGPQLRQVYRGKDGPAQVRAIIMHELGHVVGLGHVSNRTEIMKPAASRETTTWGPGDRAGLAQLGGGRCITY